MQGRHGRGHSTTQQRLAEKVLTQQDRAGQGMAGQGMQGRIEQDRAEQGRAGQGSMTMYTAVRQEAVGLDCTGWARKASQGTAMQY